MTGTQKIATLVILPLAAALRFYNYHQLQFSHDEISALNRTGYGQFSDLIEKGVKVEGHPAGVQTWLHYYTRWFGYEEWVVKLPFTLLSLAGIVLVIFIGQNLKRPGAGLLTAACLAVMQHFVMYGQLARPYGFGLFFVLLAGYFYTRYFFRKEHWHSLLGFSLAAAGAAYSHQFSLLAIALMGLSGFFRLKREQLWPYLLACIFIFVLYLPHLGLFFHQLSMGGVGSWLAPPQPHFIFQYLSYLSHYSWIFGLCLLVVILLRLAKPASLIFWEGLLWFGISFGLGFFYSLFVNPVLQFSVLVFSAPFLLLFLFSLGKGAFSVAGSAIILLAGSISLFQSRAHYPFFYYSPFGKPLQEFARLKAEEPNSLFLHKLYPKKLRFYQSQWQVDSSQIYYQPDDDALHEAQTLVQNKKPASLLLAMSDDRSYELLHILLQDYGIVEHQRYFNLETWQLSPHGKKQPLPLWQADGKWPADSLHKQEYGGGIDITLADSLRWHPEDYFLSRWQISTRDTFCHSEIAVALYAADSLVHWETQNLSDFQNQETFTAYQAFFLPQKWQGLTNLRLKIFIYHHDKIAAVVQPLSLELFEGNRKIYGRFHPFD